MDGTTPTATEHSDTGGPDQQPDGLKRRLMQLHRDEWALTTTEYIVLAVLVATFIIAIVSVYGQRIQRLFNSAVDTLYRDVGRVLD